MNIIKTDGFSNINSEELYQLKWPNDKEAQKLYSEGVQCGACSFFAELNADWGICCRPESKHHLETVFEHFTCTQIVHEGWRAHSFTDDEEFHCTCTD